MRETSMTEENEPFSFAAPFTTPAPAPEPEPASTVEDIDSMTVGQTITITGIVKDGIYADLRRKYEEDVAIGTLEMSYHRTDHRDNHNEWAKGGTITVTRK